MAEVSLELVKQLRDKTNAGMMDCKKALAAANGDFEAAVDWLRKNGLAAVAKKSGRVAAEGLIGVASTGTTAALVEVNAETDFVARNNLFQALVHSAAKGALTATDIDALKSAPVLEATADSAANVGDELVRLVAVIGENMQLRRMSKLSVGQGLVATYVHSAIAPNMGKIGVAVALESSASAEGLADLGKKLAMHIAAAAPVALDVASVDPELVARERAIVTEQAQASGRPADVIQKMIEGRLRKYYEEVVLLEQAFVMDGKTKISDVVAQAAKDLGAAVTLKGFVRYALGEGIEKQESNFADDVRAMQG